MNMKKIIIFWAFLLAGSLAEVPDYYNQDFDKDKNCESKELINELFKTNKNRCVKIDSKDKYEALRMCKKELQPRLLHECRLTQVLEPGKLLYCHDHGITNCCFNEHKCESTWDDINKKYEDVAIDYMKNKKEVLDKEKKELGYKTCHPIKGHDASKCAEDCKEHKDSPLAKECEKRNGLFKCCIRRDKKNCDDCQFCCTLPFCTYEDQINGDRILRTFGEEFLAQNDTILGDQDYSLKAINSLEAYNVFFKGRDNRCLKPYSSEKPKDWVHYVPESFVNAATEEELEQAETKEFDKRFFNFEDEGVMKKMLGKDKETLWKETYGFDYVHTMDEVSDKDKSGDRSYLTPCAKKCLKEEQSLFGKDCAKDGGLLKCCVNTLTLDVFDEMRLRLKKEKLIDNAEKLCNENEKNCWLCTLTVSCTKKDVHTGQITQKFKTETVNSIGGVTFYDENEELKRAEFRNSFCIKLDFCSTNELVYDPNDFYLAANRTELCESKTTAISEVYANKTIQNNEDKEDCAKRTSNVRICPDEIIEKSANPNLERINKKLKKTLKKMRKAKEKSKKKKKTKKSKKGKKSRKGKKKKKSKKGKKGKKKKKSKKGKKKKKKSKD